MRVQLELPLLLPQLAARAWLMRLPPSGAAARLQLELLHPPLQPALLALLLPSEASLRQQLVKLPSAARLRRRRFCLALPRELPALPPLHRHQLLLVLLVLAASPQLVLRAR